jgi:hypothetical protein
MGINSVNFNQSTDYVTAGHEAKQGLQRMQQILGESNSASRQPTMNEMHQERQNAVQNQKDNVAHMAATAAAGAVAAKAAAGAVASAKSSSDSGTIDYAAVHMEDLKGQLQNAKNEPPGPARDAKVAQLKTDIAAAKANASSSTSSGNTDSTSTDNSTSSSGNSTSSAKAVKSKLEGEIKKLEAQLKEQVESGDLTVQDKLNRLQKDLNHVNWLVKAENLDIPVTA